MKLLIITKTNSEYTRLVADWLRDFTRQTGEMIESVDPDTRDGISLCQTYDIVEYPTLIALDDRGTLQAMWRGTTLPTISDVSYYLQ